jgi:ParB family chromosome partitioning protein
LGKKRTTVTNFLRLLKLPPEIQLGIRENKLSMGHAKAIMGLDEEATQLMVFEQILKYDFSVRKTEDIVRELKEGNVALLRKKNKKTLSEYDALKVHLSNFFKTKVDLKVDEKGKGKIVIPFKTNDDLSEIIAILDKLEN